LTELIELCNAGDVYVVERWMRRDRPLQLFEEALPELRNIFQADQLACPRCGDEMRIVSFITETKTIDNTQST